MRARLTFLLLATSLLLKAADSPRTQGRSMVISPYGIVASESPLASQAGAAILSAGGSAADAAVAANAVMGVVAPMSCGVGGDMFCIYYEVRTGRLYGLNASGWAPRGLTPIHLAMQGVTNEMPKTGINTVTVPGAVSGWDMLIERFGRKKLPEILAQGIAIAENGHPVTEIVHSYWKASERVLQRDPEAAKTYLLNGVAPEVGQLFRNPNLAAVYRSIAAHGRDGYYKGHVAEQIVRRSRELGGAMKLEDLSEFAAQWVEPISTTYHDWTVYEIPPNGQGIAALGMLNLMERFPLREYGWGSTAALHTMIECKKLAYLDMLAHVADQRFSQAPVAAMLDKNYAVERAKGIDAEKANAHAGAGNLPGGTDTVYLCAVDREGNMISYIQSNYEGFGSGIVPPGLGFALQNRGALFTLDPKHPNSLAGRKRPLHTIIPAFMSKGNQRIAFGIMGGWNQSQAHAQFVANVVDFDMNIQRALEAPRFTQTNFVGNQVQIESRISMEVRTALTAKGHDIKVLPPFSTPVGGGQAVMRDVEQRINYGASDPRKDGAAVPEAYPLKRP